jgi:hypothetical protein
MYESDRSCDSRCRRKRLLSLTSARFRADWSREWLSWATRNLELSLDPAALAISDDDAAVVPVRAIPERDKRMSGPVCRGADTDREACRTEE